MIMNGRVVGRWRRVLGKKAVVLTMEPFASLEKLEKEAFITAAERYSEFIGLPVTITNND
jgi:hypothetical protein